MKRWQHSNWVTTQCELVKVESTTDVLIGVLEAVGSLGGMIQEGDSPLEPFVLICSREKRANV